MVHLQSKSAFQKDSPQERLVGHILHFSRFTCVRPFLKKPEEEAKGTQVLSQYSLLEGICLKEGIRRQRESAEALLAHS